MFLGREALKDHSQLPKRLTNAALGWLQAFRMYGGIGMSASSLHRESTDSLCRCCVDVMLGVESLIDHGRILNP